MGFSRVNREDGDAMISNRSSTVMTAGIPEPPEAFHFWNGDEYSGQFATQKDKQKVVMEGRGTYKTAEGETYEGVWEDDSLKEATRITYRDKSVFTGYLEDMAVVGPGRFLLKENVEIEGEFVDNALTGKVYLKDPRQHSWRGEVKGDDAFVVFYPLHPFWQSVLGLTVKSQVFYDGEENESGEFF